MTDFHSGFYADPYAADDRHHHTGRRNGYTVSPEELHELERKDCRDDLLLRNWLTRDLPPRDYLLGNVLCSTSRWLIFGDTGVGKTLFAMAVGGAIASGLPLLNWAGQRRSRVMYLDGELPAETFKDRMEMVARSYGEDIAFYGYSRDVMEPADMPPLNTEQGQRWLDREIEKVKPDFIIFDSIMCLTVGKMSDEEFWDKELVRSLSARRIGQIWLNHTGHDTERSFGTKTREWEMDTVVGLFKADEDNPYETAMRLEFRKARLRTPETVQQFAPCVIRLDDNGEWVADGIALKAHRDASQGAVMQRAILAAYDRLADRLEPTAGFNGAPVRKVDAERLRDHVKDRGFLDADDKGHVTATARKAFGRAKGALIDTGKLVENQGQIWKP